MENTNSNIVGVDVGGTNMRAGLVADGRLKHIESCKIFDGHDEKGTLNQLIALIAPFVDNQTAAIGIGVPSVVDPENGIVYDTANIPSWKAVPVRDILTKQFGIPVLINNDANCFALGEKHFGHGKNVNHMIGLITGTGTGAGIIANGKLINGHNCGAGEFGMVPYLDKFYEFYCSGGFFYQAYGVEAIDAYHAALEQQDAALVVWEEFGKHMAALIKMICYTNDPEMIVLGGSLSKAYQFFEKSMMKHLEDYAFQQSLRRLKIKTTELENIAILGAASLYYNSI